MYNVVKIFDSKSGIVNILNTCLDTLLGRESSSIWFTFVTHEPEILKTLLFGEILKIAIWIHKAIKLVLQREVDWNEWKKAQWIYGHVDDRFCNRKDELFILRHIHVSKKYIERERNYFVPWSLCTFAICLEVFTKKT